MISNSEISSFLDRQWELWPEARSHFDDLKRLFIKKMQISGIEVQVQFNPKRAFSTHAKVDNLSVSRRPCFLCVENRPSGQIDVPWKNYSILINPYPILPYHLTIADKMHVGQTIDGRITDMLALAKYLDGFLVLYNGSRCGASAPDHFHFQAVEKGYTALEQMADRLFTHEKAIQLEIAGFSGRQIWLTGNDTDEISSCFGEIYKKYQRKGSDDEPMMNIFCRYTDNLWQLCMIPRRKHRPDCYFAEGDTQMLISPGALDMAGVVVTSRKNDFDRISSSELEQIYREVAIFES